MQFNVISKACYVTALGEEAPKLILTMNNGRSVDACMLHISKANFFPVIVKMQQVFSVKQA